VIVRAETRTELKRLIPPLGVLAVVCAIAITLTAALSRDEIAHNRRQAALDAIEAIVPAPYDNDPVADRLAVAAPGVFGRGGPVCVYRARRDGRPQGVVFMPVIARGYNGPIRLAVGVGADGTLSGVRVLEQHESAGLGDAVDQEVSGWILGFTGRSLDNTPAGSWAVRKDGGEFDQLTGATITSRGVINSIRRVLEFYAGNKKRLLEERD
jgi:electron transport complex protein RnfG